MSERTGRGFAYAGAGLIVAGSLLPFTHLIFGDMNAFTRGPGIVLIVIAITTTLLVRSRRYAALALCGFGTLFVLWRHSVAITETTVVTRTLAGDTVGAKVYLQYGFWVVAAGGVLLLGAALTPKLHARGNAVR